jgi:hypothetical protein
VRRTGCLVSAFPAVGARTSSWSWSEGGANTNQMGDRNPKSQQKRAAQKQSKANDVNQLRVAAVAAQQATKARMAALKRK